MAIPEEVNSQSQISTKCTLLSVADVDGTERRWGEGGMKRKTWFCEAVRTPEFLKKAIRKAFFDLEIRNRIIHFLNL